jgi:hypothetical protein
MDLPTSLQMQYGGAIYSYGGPHTLQSVTFQENSAQVTSLPGFTDEHLLALVIPKWMAGVVKISRL